MKQKCAFFDFDYTIAHGDSIRKLLSYTLKKILYQYSDFFHLFHMELAMYYISVLWNQ